MFIHNSQNGCADDDDGNSFLYTPLELCTVAQGVNDCSQEDQEWLIRRSTTNVLMRRAQSNYNCKYVNCYFTSKISPKPRSVLHCGLLIPNLGL